MTDKKEKKCNKCSVVLTDENKSNSRPICLACKSAYDAEYRKNKKLKDLEDLKVGLEKKCNKCSIVLEGNNKIIGSPTCRACTNLCKQASTKIKILKDMVDTTERKCTKCQIILTNENRAIGRTTCKPCKNEAYIEYVETKLSKKYSEDKDIKCNVCSILLTDEIKVPNRPICKECHNKKCREYKKETRAKLAEVYKDNSIINKDKWQNENSEFNKGLKLFTNDDPFLKVIKNCAMRIKGVLNGHELQSLKLLDCDASFLKEWLQSNFKEGMTFENYGDHWHVDHIIPCSKFNLENDDEIKHCFRWTNVQPLEAKINLSKQAKINKKEITEHYRKVKCHATAKNIKIEDFDFTKYC